MWYFFVVLVCIASVSSHDRPHISQTNSQALDIYIQRLKQENWEEEESPCLEKTLSVLENVRNFTLWATWVWNANTLPAGNLYASWVSLGNFDQCMKPPWLDTHPHLGTQYCLTKATLSDKPKNKPEFHPYGFTDEYLNSPTKIRYPVNLQRWGVCVPAACNPSSVAKITRAMYDIIYFGTVQPNITVKHCQVAGTKYQYPIGFYLFFMLIAVLVITAAISTYYRNVITTEEEYQDSLKSIISKSFCILKNHHDLVRENKEEIKVMNGMRFLTALSIVPLHVIFYMSLSAISNPLDFDKSIEGLSGLFFHLDIVVDTFFVMSGLLHIKGLLANADRQQNLFKVLWKRYIRLIGPFALAIFYLISVSTFTGSGPLWLWSNELESEVCARTWKLSLLMLNSNPRDVCYAVTWYIPCDYQLAILGTVLFYFYQKDRRLGFAAFGIAAILSLLIPAALTYWLQLPPIHFLKMGNLQLILRDYWELRYTYMSSYSRAGAYLVGVATGYLMTVCRPANYRKTISKTWSIIGTAVSLVMMCFMLSLGQIYVMREYSPMEAAFIAATNRVTWAIAVSCIIALCEYGTVPLVSDFLSLSIFTPLSRLSYGIYIIHPLIVQRNTFTLRSPHQYDMFSIITTSLGTAVLSVALSYIMWILVEAPLINLSNNLLFNRTKSKESEKGTENGQNGVLNQNGQDGVLHQNGHNVHVKTKTL